MEMVKWTMKNSWRWWQRNKILSWEWEDTWIKVKNRDESIFIHLFSIQHFDYRFLYISLIAFTSRLSPFYTILLSISSRTTNYSIPSPPFLPSFLFPTRPLYYRLSVPFYRILYAIPANPFFPIRRNLHTNPLSPSPQLDRSINTLLFSCSLRDPIVGSRSCYCVFFSLCQSITPNISGCWVMDR